MSTIQQKTHQTIWHPCSQMKDYESFKPLVIEQAAGCYITLNNKQKILDAISSWWCKSLGHNHPRLKKALINQAERFEHVIFANTTYETIVNLSEKLISKLPNLSKIFYAGDGSCAVEIAMKMSIHSRVIKGDTQRTQFMGLKNGYHGETTAALSVSDLGIYKDAYQSMLLNPIMINPIPYVSGENDPLWHNAEEYWLKALPELEKHKQTVTAIIFEPILQGAGGMLVYSPDFLKRLAVWAKTNDIHLIADEIMTGVGRTGKFLACEYAEINPDFVCLSKGLTSGWLPFSCVMTTNEIYDLFYDDYANGKSFLHSHTFSGNALGAAIALEVLNIIEEDNLINQANTIGRIMKANMQLVADQTQMICNIRQVGAMVACDLKVNIPSERLGFKLYQIAVNEGILLRPLGNTIYWLPPLIADEFILEELKSKTLNALTIFKSHILSIDLN
ncbi:adenosylmethionine--8-amino-7-oxononanoate transaminase [Thiotrichales bacterium 19S3-7]|nr:adenosylmethionine--8-amino-7-oxononanoate transaminase [Thiotrichales bacterium 19S3-7]MCF6802710.1 adenosylmethionine--8-amino-7-oxononanoate transaminase [Thiotrichales bacterium 19S3-11]